MEMKLLFLGTAAAEGWPAVFCQCENCKKARKKGGKNIRTRSSVIIDSDLKIDLPPDTYHHVIKYNLDLAKVENILVTHSHQDHFYPEELNMRAEPFAKILNQKFLTIYGNEKVFMKIQNSVERRVLENSVKAKVLRPYEETNVGSYHVVPLLADHAEDEQCLIYIISKGNKTILYGHDSGWFPEESWKVLKNFKLDLAILDCTNGALPQIKYHMGIEGDIKTKNKMLENGIASKDTLFVATHFSHNGGLLHEELKEKLEPNGISVAYDGMTLEL